MLVLGQALIVSGQGRECVSRGKEGVYICMSVLLPLLLTDKEREKSYTNTHTHIRRLFDAMYVCIQTHHHCKPYTQTATLRVSMHTYIYVHQRTL